MTTRTLHRGRESGVVLFASLLLTLLLFSLVASTVMVSNAESKAVDESEVLQAAFFYAEAGVEAAKYEINESVDPDKNGIGNATSADYTATAEPLSSSVWRVTSTGTSRGENVTVEAVVSKDRKSSFPDGAISILGAFDSGKVSIKKHAGLVIAGGDSPAVTIQDKSLYDEMGEDFANAFKNGDMPAINLTGTEMNAFTVTKGKEKGSTVKLPLSNESETPEPLSDLDALYDSVVSKLESTLLPTLTQVDELSSGDVTFGTAESPASVYLTKDKVRIKNQSLTGYGTIVVQELIVKQGATFDWKGDVFVIGDAKQKAMLTVKDGASFSVEGNLVILGEGKGDVEVRIDSASLKVDGSFFLGSNYDDSKKSKGVKLDVEKGGTLDVDGVMTMIGANVKAVFKVGSEVTVTGMVQIGGPETAKDSSVKLDFRGDTEIYRDSDRISNALAEWEGLSATLDTNEVARLIESEVTTMSWGRKAR
jgi:hypothetical protein